MNDLLKRIFCCITFLLIVSTDFGQDSASVASLKRPTDSDRKSQFGVVFGIGQSKLRPITSNWNQGAINYNDSLNSIEARSIFKLELGLVYQQNLSKAFAIRPALFIMFKGGQLLYNRKQLQEKRKVPVVSTLVSAPLIIKYPGRTWKPYIGIGPSILATLGQEKNDEPVYVPLNHFDIIGDLLAGIEWKSHVGILSTEVRYSKGFANVKSDANTLYTNTIQSLHREAFTFSICIRQ